MFIFTIFSTLVFLVFIKAEGGGNWGYQTGQSFKSPEEWSSLSGASCGGRRQSPINIIKKNAQYWSGLQPLTISSSTASNMVSLQNSSTSLNLYFSNTWNLNFNGVGCLKPIAIHWHWGSKDSQGSEHYFDNTQYPMEGHLVTYNCLLYNNSADATLYASGLYVFSILYNVGISNPAIEKFMPFIDIVLSNGSTKIQEISPSEFLPKNLGSYYRYEGSLTTPPCTENVIWTVFHEIQTISAAQLAKFRSLQFGHPQKGAMCDNFRPYIPLQPYSDYMNRVVYTSINNGNERRLIFSVTCLVIALAIMLKYA